MEFFKKPKRILFAAGSVVVLVLGFIIATLQRINNDSRSISIEQLSNDNYEVLKGSIAETYTDFYQLDNSSIQKTELDGESVFTGMYSSRNGEEKEFAVYETRLSNRSEGFSIFSLIVVIGLIVIGVIAIIWRNAFKYLEGKELAK